MENECPLFILTFYLCTLQATFSLWMFNELVYVFALYITTYSPYYTHVHIQTNSTPTVQKRK